MVYGPFLYKGKAKGMFIPFTQSCQAGMRLYLKNKKAGSLKKLPAMGFEIRSEIKFRECCNRNPRSGFPR